MRFEYTDCKNPDFLQLCRELDEYLNEIAGGEENRSQYIAYNQPDGLQDVLVAYDDDMSVGCAALKDYDSESAEVKRVFVRKDYRGRGVSKALMGLLEDKAKEKGYSSLVLESGEPLVEAMGLYKSMGFYITENYGQYKDMSNSVCMKKDL